MKKWLPSSVLRCMGESNDDEALYESVSTTPFFESIYADFSDKFGGNVEKEGLLSGEGVQIQDMAEYNEEGFTSQLYGFISEKTASFWNTRQSQYTQIGDGGSHTSYKDTESSGGSSSSGYQGRFYSPACKALDDEQSELESEEGNHPECCEKCNMTITVINRIINKYTFPENARKKINGLLMEKNISGVFEVLKETEFLIQYSTYYKEALLDKNAGISVSNYGN